MVRRLMLLALLGLSAGIIAGFFGFAHPAFDTFAQFRLHFSVALIGIAAIWSAKFRRIPPIAFAILGIAGLATCAPGLPGISARADPLAGEKIRRLLHFNLRFDNPDHSGVLDMIARANADILSLGETSTLWDDALDKLRPAYPHVYHCPEWSRIGGVMIFSKFPFAGEREFCGDYASLALKDVTIDGRKIAIGSAHLRWPWPASGPRQVTALKTELEGLGRDALIAGDFNAATWSHTLARFAEYGGLDIAPGIGPTWLHGWLPASLAKWAGWPIDNALSKGDVKIVGARTLEPAGSDHLPVLIEFIVRDTECCARK